MRYQELQSSRRRLFLRLRLLGFEIFNLGNSATVSLNEALDIVSRITGRELIIEQHSAQPGDVEITNADISKARRLLEYTPKTSFEDGMRTFNEWYRLNVNV